jgi:hypothetical protein
MQTSIWMAYSDSTHFSEQLSYKILFILSYGFKDMILASVKHLQQFFRKAGKEGKQFLTDGEPARVADRRGRGADDRDLPVRSEYGSKRGHVMQQGDLNTGSNGYM